jgi:excisionase family DNA binding protein
MEHFKETQPFPLLLTVAQTAKLLNIGCTKVRMLMSSGALAKVHIGRSVRIPAAALQAWLQQCEQQEGERNGQA